MPAKVKDQLKWMKCPVSETEYPSLAFVCKVNEFIVADRLDAYHKITGKGEAGYTILNQSGEKVFLAIQKKGCQQFNVRIYNFYGNEVMNFIRPKKLFLNKVSVWAPPGNFVGSVEGPKWLFNNTFLVKNKEGAVVSKLVPQGYFSVTYDLLVRNKKVGVIMNNWYIATLLNVKSFGISFPMDMSVADKAVLLGGCYLIACLKYQ